MVLSLEHRRHFHLNRLRRDSPDVPPEGAIPEHMLNLSYAEFVEDLATLSDRDFSTLCLLVRTRPTRQTFYTLRDLSSAPVPLYRLYRFLFVYSHSFDHDCTLYDPGDTPGNDALTQMRNYALNHRQS